MCYEYPAGKQLPQTISVEWDANRYCWKYVSRNGSNGRDGRPAIIPIDKNKLRWTRNLRKNDRWTIAEKKRKRRATTTRRRTRHAPERRPGKTAVCDRTLRRRRRARTTRGRGSSQLFTRSVFRETIRYGAVRVGHESLRPPPSADDVARGTVSSALTRCAAKARRGFFIFTRNFYYCLIIVNGYYYYYYFYLFS